MLSKAGFVHVKFHGWTGYHTSPYTEGALVTARKRENKTQTKDAAARL
jgi:hypothetical protein